MYRLLATTVLAGVGVLFSHPALAQVITFPAQTPGTLAQPTGNFYRLETVTNATATVNITGAISATVQVTEPTFISGSTNDPAGTIRVATLTFNSISINSGDAAVSIPVGVTNLSVSMAVDRPEIYPPGTYIYQVTITVIAVPE